MVGRHRARAAPAADHFLVVGRKNHFRRYMQSWNGHSRYELCSDGKVYPPSQPSARPGCSSVRFEAGLPKRELFRPLRFRNAERRHDLYLSGEALHLFETNRGGGDADLLSPTWRGLWSGASAPTCISASSCDSFRSADMKRPCRGGSRRCADRAGLHTTHASARRRAPARSRGRDIWAESSCLPSSRTEHCVREGSVPWGLVVDSNQSHGESTVF